MNYYNENAPDAAAWLHECIRAGLIPPGDVDERSITEVKPTDLYGYTQHHFFAGIGGWPFALHLAGWPADRPVWTGSCPCQPFSCAGKGLGQRDARHLWPKWLRLIAEYGGLHSVPVIFGEQVASRDGREWFVGVRASLETLGYAVGAADLCAAGVGAPHIRQRLYWVAHAGGIGCNPRGGKFGWADSARNHRDKPEPNGQLCGVAHAADHGRTKHVEESRRWIIEKSDDAAECQGTGGVVQSHGHRRASGEPASASPGHGGATKSASSNGGRVGHTPSHDEWRTRKLSSGLSTSFQAGRSGPGSIGSVANSISEGLEVGGRKATSEEFQAIERSSANCWSEYDLIGCADGKARRIEPGTFPLAHGVPGRVGLLRGYGNAIVPQIAAEFIQASVDADPTG